MKDVYFVFSQRDEEIFYSIGGKMDNLLFSIEVVLPTFIMIFLGYFLMRIRLFDDHTLKVMNNVTFKCFLPLLLFYNVYNTELGESININLILFAVITITVLFIVLCLIIPRIENENKRRGVLVQAIFRSNFVLFGMPIAISLFGDRGASITSLLIAIIIPLYNFLAVIALEIFKGGKINFIKVIKGIITNPLIISSLLGLVMIYFNIKFPIVVEDTIGKISKIATPLALIILGASFKFSSIKNTYKQVLIGIIGKLVVVPGIFVALAILIGFKGAELGVLIVIYGAPTAVSSYTMAEQMGSDGQLAAQQVVFSSVFSGLTMFLLIYLTKSFGYI